LKSYAHVRRHPIHPALIPFPIAFLVATALFDASAWAFDRPAWAAVASYLLPAGLLTGVVAAVPGLLDFLKRVPPESSGRRRAARHGIANAAALAVFFSAWWLRPESGAAIGHAAIELLGAAALGYSGWLGGVLVSRNMISVDHRHANAGKWKEERHTVPRGKPLVVAERDELDENQMKLLVVNGFRIALARTNGKYAAVQDGCTHRGGSLADGVCIDGVVQCLWHGSQFDLSSGEVRCGPAKRKIKVYEVKEEQERVILVSPPG
jgi:nitrite reductase/ring-hydroxylating ferredoxin subunit/uncharacterized membrane protein